MRQHLIALSYFLRLIQSYALCTEAEFLASKILSGLAIDIVEVRNCVNSLILINGKNLEAKWVAAAVTGC